MATEIGNLIAKVSMDQTGFQQGISKLNRELKVVQSEFKASSAQLGDFGKSTEGLKLKADSLTKQIELQTQKVQALEGAYKESAKTRGLDAKETQNFAIDLTNARAKMAQMENELKKTTAELEKQSSTWYKLSQSCEEAGRKLAGVGKKMTDVGKDLSMKITAPLVAIGAASFKFAADLEDAIGAADQIFGNQSQEMQKWADSLENYYGISEGEALTYANTMGAMLQNIGGLSEAEAAKQSQILVELAGDLTAMFGGTTQDAVRALTGALKGNNSMLDNYGMGVNEATIKTKALEMGLIVEGEQLDLAGKQAATLALIMEQTADAQGQAAREAGGASGSMRGLATELKNVAGELGDVLLPILTPLIARLRDLIKSFEELSPETQKTIVTVALLAAAVGPLLIAVGQTIGAFGTLSKALLSIIAGAKKLGAVFLWLRANPIGLVITGLGLLVAAGIAVYKNWDAVKYYGLQAWGSLKAGVLQAIASMAAAYEKLFGWIPMIGNQIRVVHAQIRQAIEEEKSILESRVKPVAAAGGNGSADASGMDTKLTAAVKNMNFNLDSAVPSFDNLGAAATGAGKSVGSAGSKMADAAEKVKTAWTGTTEALRSALGTLQTQHETEMTYAEIAGDKVAVLRLKHSQLNEELEQQKQVVAATRAEVEKATAAGEQEGETKEDLAKRIDELNKKLSDEEKAQANLEKQVFDTSESLKAQGENAKSLVAELKEVSETYNTEMAKALDDYQKKVKETNDNLRKDTEALQRDLNQKLDDIVAKGADREKQVTEQYKRELENRTRALVDFVGLFDEVVNRQVSGDTLLRNLEGQVTAFADWQENIAALAARGIDKGLLEELRAMGPKAAPEIAALTTLTDDQLTQYVSLWKQKQEQARTEATAQLAQQRTEMNRQLSDIRTDTYNQLEQQRREVAQKLTEMQTKAKEELAKYKLEWETKNEEIRKNTEKSIKDIHEKFNDLVGKSTRYGVALIENFMDGIDSKMHALINKFESIATMIDSYMPHSPAKRGPLRRIGEWGPALVGSLVEGIKRGLPTLENVTARMAMLTPGALQPAMGNSYSSASTTYGPSTYHIYIQGANADEVMEKLKREIHKTGNRW